MSRIRRPSHRTKLLLAAVALYAGVLLTVCLVFHKSTERVSYSGVVNRARCFQGGVANPSCVFTLVGSPRTFTLEGDPGSNFLLMRSGDHVRLIADGRGSNVGVVHFHDAELSR